jgi:hypothetical protein
MTKVETLPTINKNGQLSRRFTNLEAAILIWKRSKNVDTQWKVLDKIYEMWPECALGTEGSKLLNNMADKLYQLSLRK